MTSAYTIVTGGNRGLGLEVCKKLIQLKKPVILTARNVEAGKAAASALGPLATFYELDISSPASIQSFVAALHGDLPDQKIELLVNNAGINGGGKYTTDWTQDNFEKTMSTNMTGPLKLTRALMGLMKDGGMIINVSSELGLRKYIKDQSYTDTIHASKNVDDVVASLKYNADSSMNGERYGTYSISKAAIGKATKLMSEEPAFKGRHIRLVSIAPGWCSTGMGSLEETDDIVAPRSAEEGADSILMPFLHYSEQLNGAYLEFDGKPFEDL